MLNLLFYQQTRYTGRPGGLVVNLEHYHVIASEGRGSNPGGFSPPQKKSLCALFSSRKARERELPTFDENRRAVEML